MQAFAKASFAIAILLMADATAAYARDQHHHHGARRRIGRILRPFIPTMPLLFQFGGRDSFDYYGNRRIVPKARGPVNQNDIISSLKKRGFHDIKVPKHRGSTYVVEATGSLGERVRLIINGKTGNIDGVRVIGIGKR
ncbi:MAG TPA: hypothetical protein VHD34_04560 [Xanthobacteraceae bacterium]|nr:hypothetical protein [Xanthobacteraceae bacterium]